LQIRDVSQPELSPDGQWVAYAVRARLLKDDKSEQRLWMVGTRGGDPIPLTAEAVSSTHPAWSPDGKYLSFVSARNGAKNQVWLLAAVAAKRGASPKSPRGSTTSNGRPTAPASSKASPILKNSV